MHLKPFLSTGRCLVLAGLVLPVAGSAQLARNATKYMGNITTSGQVRSDFLSLWNQITAENECKWSSVEGTRDRMNWAGCDRVANFARQNNIPWRFHTLVWGRQYPSWMDGLSTADQLAEITEWFDEAAARYPDVNEIDVVNEGLMNNPHDTSAGIHAPPPWRGALGGAGATGFDWIITSFQMARARWPNAILIYNDYNIVEWQYAIDWLIRTIPQLRNAGAPIDAVGLQGHDLYNTTAAQLQSRLDAIHRAIQIPMYVTEYDIGRTDDQEQLRLFQQHIPVMWNHPQIAGVTLWGYILGSTWIEGSGIIRPDGTDRPAMTWLRQFIAANPNPPVPTVRPGGGGTAPPVARRAWRGDTAVVPGTIQVENYDEGGQGVAYNDADATNSGGAYRTGEGVDVAGSGNAHVVGWLSAGEWMEYTVRVNRTARFTWQAAVASDGTAGSFRLRAGTTDLTGPVSVPNTGSFTTYTELSGSMLASLPTGVHRLRLEVVGAPFNIDSIRILDIPAGLTERPTLALPDHGTFEIHDLRGNYLGRVETGPGTALSTALRAVIPTTGLVVVRSVETGAVARMQVGL